MKKRTFISIIIMALLATSCIFSSLFPLYTEKDLRTDDRIVGKWLMDGDEGETDYWIIEKLDTSRREPDFTVWPEEWSNYNTGKTYRMVVVQDSLQQEFAVHLLEIYGIQYLDFYPVNYELSHEFLAWHMVPVHIFAKAEIRSDMLILHFFNPDYLSELIKQNKIRISHIDMDGTQLITAETEELQKFVKKFSYESHFYQAADTLPKLPV